MQPQNKPVNKKNKNIFTQILALVIKSTTFAPPIKKPISQNSGFDQWNWNKN